MTMTDPATKKPATSKGSYLTVWQKQTDGAWKAVEDFVTPGPDAAK
jgi:ketosteroid isomerase-like protein